MMTVGDGLTTAEWRQGRGLPSATLLPESHTHSNTVCKGTGARGKEVESRQGGLGSGLALLGPIGSHWMATIVYHPIILYTTRLMLNTVAQSHML